jgi:hypothetical protein
VWDIVWLIVVAIFICLLRYKRVRKDNLERHQQINLLTIATLVTILVAFFTVANYIWIPSVREGFREDIREIRDDIKGIRGTLYGEEGVLVRLAVINKSVEDLKRDVKELKSAHITVLVPATSEGGKTPSIKIFNPSEQLFRTITIQDPAGWVSKDTQLMASASYFPDSGLAPPENYQLTNWRFSLSTPYGFSSRFSIAIELTKEDLKLAEQPDLLTLLQWSSQEHRWIELDSRYIPEANTIQADLALLESPSYLALAVKTSPPSEQ